MKIAFLTRSLHLGGAERQLVILSKKMKAAGHDVVVLVFYSGGALEGELREAGVPIIALDKRGRWDMGRFIWRLATAIRKHDPEIVHGYLSVPNLFTILIKLLFPRIRIAWGVRASYLDRPEWTSKLVYWLECRLSCLADAIVVNSQAGRKFALLNGFAAEKMVVVPNGIDTAYFKCDRSAGRQLRCEWKIADDEVLVGIVGRLDPMKDHQTFLRAAALAFAKDQRLRFICVGDGPTTYKEALQTLAWTLGLTDQVIWTGPRYDLPAVYSALDMLVSSSYGEGFPNVIGEAMACEVPCIVTDVGDSAWIVGDARFVVPARNSHALAEAILCALSSHKDPTAIRRRIEAEFSIEHLAARTETILSKTLASVRSEPVNANR